MAEIQPLRALRYDPHSVGPLDAVAAPPYDVIDDEMRAELASRSPFNVVEVDLPRADDGGDPYAHAEHLWEGWQQQGIAIREREPSLWVLTQDYTGPDGTAYTRHGFFARVRVEDYGPGRIRPHERTQPGPKEDRLRLTRATRHNLSPIFSLHEGDAWRHLEGHTRGEPWAEVTDDDGTVHRVWRIGEPDVHRAVTAELAESELLIADGHHRYETARTYADEIGDDGPHRYTLMALVSLSDPGLTVFGYHRLLSNLGEPGPQGALRDAIRANFEVSEVPLDQLDPAGEEGIGVFGYVDAHHRQGYRLKLNDPSVLEAAMPGVSTAYRELDAAILESLLLRDALGMSADDIEAKRGIAYTASTDKALSALDEGIHAAFLMRPTPVQQVREVAAAGETMPPKSTYFFPKLLTGIVFNPLS
jgi:uncharacterized protein (DUF1015 family)